MPYFVSFDLVSIVFISFNQVLVREEHFLKCVEYDASITFVKNVLVFEKGV